MAKLKTLSALGAHEGQVLVFEGLNISENTNLALASLAIRQGADEISIGKIEKYMSTKFPAPMQYVQCKSFGIFWLGIDQYMIDADYNKHENLAGEIKSIAGSSASISEQSDAWVVFDLEGARAKGLFSRLCVQDIESFEIGTATRVLIEHLGAYVLRMGADHYRILAPRSSAASLQHAMITAYHSMY